MTLGMAIAPDGTMRVATDGLGLDSEVILLAGSSKAGSVNPKAT